MSVLEFRPEGIYCSQGNFYIDPWRPVERALITHGHSDHARYGSKKYLCTEMAAPVIRHRLGDIKIETIPYEKEINLNGVNISFHPAGHVPGSAQILVEIKGERWVVSGDYKIVNDGLSTPFEPVKCHSFISECTFGLPAFNWLPQKQIFQEINNWWVQCNSEGLIPVLAAYGLGKAQRLISGLDSNIGPILTHGAIEKTNQIMRQQKITIPETTIVSSKLKLSDLKNAIVLAPPSALSTSWIKKFGKISTAYASGWMAIRGIKRRRSADKGFVISDHADWAGLNWAIRETEAEKIFVTHGYTESFSKWLRFKGLDASIVKTEFATIEEDI